MSGLIILVGSLLRRRIGQSVLVAVMLAASALMLSSAVTLLVSLNKPFERMFERQRASHLVLTFDSLLYDAAELADWWRQKPEVDRVTPVLAMVETTEASLHQGVELSSTFYLVERPAAPMAQDQLAFVDGAERTSPGPGEIWIPTALAHASGLEVGDLISMPVPNGLVSLRVAAVVVDPQFSSAFMNPTRVWTAPGALSLLFPASSLGVCMLGVRLNDPAQMAKLWDAFAAWTGGGFNGRALRHETVLASYTAVASFVAVLLMVFALIALGVALFLISTTLTSAVLADYRQIGVLKAQGFTPRQLTGIYLAVFAVLALLALPPGIVGGLLLSEVTLGFLLRALAVTQVEAPRLLIGLATFAGLLGVIVLVTALLGRRAGQVRSIDAIRHGGPPPSARQSRQQVSWAGAPTALLLALRDLQARPRRALLATLTVAATAFMVLFSVNLISSFSRMGAELPRWGFDGAEVRVHRQARRLQLEHGELVHRLADQPGVRSVVAVDYLVEGAAPARAGRSSRTLIGTAVDGDFAAAGFLNARGRHPQAPGEISLALGTARDDGVEVGQTYALMLQGRQLQLRVTGLYQSVQNLGQGFRLHADTLRQVDPIYQPRSYALGLAAGNDRQQLIATIEKQLGETVDAEPGDRFVASVVRSIVGSMTAAFSSAVLIFLLVALVFIASATLMDVREQRRTLGVLKAAGMTPLQLRGLLTVKAALLSSLGMVLGALLWAVGSRPLLDGAFAKLGFLSFPLSVHLPASLAVAVLLVLLCSWAAWIAARPVVAIQVRSLVVE
ncbi:MAG: ABC transporter permease [Pseudomonadota bacterium]